MRRLTTMRLLRLVLAVLATAGVLVVVSPSPALACSCAGGSTRYFVEGADEVVAGTLIRWEDPPERLLMSSADPIAYTVSVDAVYKGDVGDEVVFESAMSGASCGLEGMSVGQRYVFFLTVADEQRHASLCGGTADASPRLVSAVERLTGPPSQPASEPAVEQAAGPGPIDARIDDDVPAQPAVPTWVLATGALGLAFVAGGVLWLVRRGRSSPGAD